MKIVSIGNRVVSTVTYSSSDVDVMFSGYWLGGYLSVPEKEFKWTDNSNSTFRPFASGELVFQWFLFNKL